MEESKDQSHERELLARIELKDQRALREFHTVYGRRIYAFALRRLRDPDEAETIVSDTLFEIWKHPSGFRGESRFSTWLLGIARYKVLMLLRARPPQHEELDETMPDKGLGSFETFANKELLGGLLRCMEQLGEIHRECLHLVLFEERSLYEVAAIQQCPENTAKTRLFHARRRIKDCVSLLLDRGH
ncbi:MAG: sigma-70 family RNA polymerase sigma factor [Burkholderiales bacterium]